MSFLQIFINTGSNTPVINANTSLVTVTPAVTPIPEPATLLPLGNGLMGMLGAVRHAQKR